MSDAAVWPSSSFGARECILRRHPVDRHQELAARTRGKFEVTVPKLCGGVVTIEPKTERTRFLGSGFPLRIDTIRGRYLRMSACISRYPIVSSKWSIEIKGDTQEYTADLVHLRDDWDEETCVQVSLAD